MAHYCIKCGSQLETRVIEGRELEACANDDFVLWRDPKVASAVVIEVDGGVVLGRRAIEPGYGLWCLPGGFVNDDEHPADAAMRDDRRVSRPQAGRAQHRRDRLSGAAGRRRSAQCGLRDAGGQRLSCGVAAGAGISEPTPCPRRISQVPGVGGGSLTPTRRRSGSAWKAAITSASAIATTAQAVKPAA